MASLNSSRRLAVQQTRTSLRNLSTSSAAYLPSSSKIQAVRSSTSARDSLTSRAGTQYAAGSRNLSTSASRRKDDADAANRHRSQYNYDPFTLHPEAKHYTYPLVTAEDLASSTSSKVGSTGPGGRPREVRMLARDFIHDSLYNPSYGYFTKQAVLLPDPSPASEKEEQYKEVAGELYTHEMGLLRPAAGFDFNSIKNESEFMRLVEERYSLFEEQISILVADHKSTSDAQDKLKEQSDSLARERRERVAARKPAAEYSAAGLEEAQRRGRALRREGVQETDVQSMAAKQVWHTPTQIFQPYYAHAIARYLVAEYKLHHYPYDDLVVYELGAGSGALAEGVLDYLQESEPEMYARTRYRIVEISPRLAAEQRRKLARHGARVEVINQDVLAWDSVVQEPCFVVALEVFDNLAHDVVRFGTADLTPYQAVVSIDDTGDMHELWEPLSDPLIRRYLDIVGPTLHPLSNSPLRFLPERVRAPVARHAPFFPNLTDPLFVPTNALRLVEKLRTHFPHHRLLMSDFHSLPDTLHGLNAPVVQTRYQGTMIPVTTYLVLQGFFDIFFPTNFAHLKQVYRSILNPSPNKPEGEGAAFFDSHWAPFHTAVGGKRVRNLKVLGHAEFLERYAETERVQLRDGSNPMLGWYANASWFLS